MDNQEEIQNVCCPFCGQKIKELPEGLEVRKLMGFAVELLRLKGFEMRKISKKKNGGK